MKVLWRGISFEITVTFCDVISQDDITFNVKIKIKW